MTIDMLRTGRSARCAAALSVLLLTLAPLAHAASLDAGPVPVKPAPASAAVSTVVIVKLGQASLEEYQHGDPAGRTQLLSGCSTAQKAAGPLTGNRHS